MSQQYRNDRIGDIARILINVDCQHKFSKRKWDEHKGWADIIIRNTEPGYIPTFNEAWQEFIMAKQAAKDTLE